MDNDQSKTIYARRIPVLGKVRQKEGTFYIEEHAVCNQAVGFLCPQCNKPVIIKPMVAGHLTAECRNCHTRVAFTAEHESDITIIPDKDPAQPAQANSRHSRNSHGGIGANAKRRFCMKASISSDVWTKSNRLTL